jgi:sRNA-binding carbon storage regulator CsrA
MSKNIPKGTRIFGNEVYRYVTTTNTKSKAKSIAEDLRRKGDKARVVLVSSGYRVYEQFSLARGNKKTNNHKGTVVMVRDEIDYDEIQEANNEYQDEGRKTRIKKTVEGYELIVY